MKSPAYVADLKGNLFERTICPPRFIVKALIFLELRGGGRISLHPVPEDQKKPGLNRVNGGLGSIILPLLHSTVATKRDQWEVLYHPPCSHSVIESSSPSQCTRDKHESSLEAVLDADRALPNPSSRQTTLASLICNPSLLLPQTACQLPLKNTSTRP